jgi:ATP-dependent DNA helicase RecQ
MWFLATALDDENPRACGRCARCLGRPVIGENFSRTLAVGAARYFRRSEALLECKKQVASGAFTVYPFRGNLAANLRAETGRVLSRWGDAGWGRSVAEDKRAGHFRDELVEAMAEMIEQRWCPQPAPARVTCVPSRNHPALVLDFARRLAARLRLPFVPAVAKQRDNQPQKFQQNRYHQCRNLDGAFAVAASIPRGPVLLVDDMVDSAWTLTVVAALLRQAGSGPVWPVALATTAGGGD